MSLSVFFESVICLTLICLIQNITFKFMSLHLCMSYNIEQTRSPPSVLTDSLLSCQPVSLSTANSPGFILSTLILTKSTSGEDQVFLGFFFEEISFCELINQLVVSHVSYIIYNSVFHLYKSNKLISNSCRFHNILEIMFLKVVGVCFSFSLNNSALTANYPCPDLPTELLGHFSQPPCHHFIFSVLSLHTHSKKKGPLFDPFFFFKGSIVDFR